MNSVIKYKLFWLLALTIMLSAFTPVKGQQYSFEFYDGTFNFSIDSTFQKNFSANLNSNNVRQFYHQLNNANTKDLISSLKNYKEKYQLNDWLYYQLIRKTAEQLSPKAKNYSSYTLYKWFLMIKSGYDARVAIGNNQIIFYIRCDEDISDIPFFIINDKKYMCLNYHDYQKMFKQADTYIPVDIEVKGAEKAFSYKVTRMPEFKPEDYSEKQITFNYKHKTYHFNVKVNTEIAQIFANYPGVDFETYFNIPLSRATYQSFIPLIKENVRGMPVKKGVDYLMQFTRYAFLYENDQENFGKEKRLSPEQTLLSAYSDCDDRVGLFFLLVKEIYNLPMIALLYPTHITMAVAFDKPVGQSISYNGKLYSVCEPTPQKRNLKIGEVADHLKKQKYEIVYAYEPSL